MSASCSDISLSVLISPLNANLYGLLLDPLSLLACIAEMAEQLPFSYLCKAVVEEENSMEREREHAHKMEMIE